MTEAERKLLITISECLIRSEELGGDAQTRIEDALIAVKVQNVRIMTEFNMAHLHERN